QHHPLRAPGPHRGPAPRVRQAREAQGRGRPDLDPFCASAREGDPRAARQGRRGRRGRGRPGREGARGAHQAARRPDRQPARRQGERAPRGLMTDSIPPTASELAAAPPSRAGRNLPVAIAVGLGLLGLVFATIFWRKEAFLVFAIVATCAALWELGQALTRRDLHLPLVPLLVGAVGILVSAYYAGA